MLVTAATDLQKDIVEGGRVSRWQCRGFAPVFGSTGRVFIINPLLLLRLWLSQLKSEQKPQPSVVFLYALPVGGSLCYGVLCQKFSLERGAHLCF